MSQTIAEQLKTLMAESVDKQAMSEQRQLLSTSRSTSTNELLDSNTIQIITEHPLWALQQVQKTDAIQITSETLNRYLFVQIFNTVGTSYLHGVIDHNNTLVNIDGKTCIVFNSARVYNPVNGIRLNSHKKVRLG